MSLKKFLILMTLGAIFCWASWVLVVFTTNPYEAGIWGFALFYTSLFLALCGTFAVGGLLVRLRVLQNYTIFRHVSTAFRQSIFFSCLIVGLLILQSQGFLTWWNALIFSFSITLMEFFFISYKGFR